MARRLPNHKRRKYYILWNDKLAGHVVSREVFQRAIASRWIVETEQGVARVVSGVKAVLKGGVLWLEDLARKANIWIYTSWIAIDRNSPIIQGEYFVRDIQREYGNVQSKKVEPDGTWVERCDWGASLA